MTTILVDNEIALRSPRLRDAERLYRLVDDNREHLGTWMNWAPAVASPADQRQFIESSLEAEAEGTDLVLLIEYDGEVIGVIGAHGLASPSRRCEIGYWLAADAQGKGIMTRACRALVSYALGTLQLNRVLIRAALGNERSRAIPKRLGFHCEGIERQGELVNDEYQDMYRYSVLASEWPPPSSG